jgi:cell division septation protein DedD
MISNRIDIIMEQAITDAYIKTIQELTRKYSEQVEQEGRKFAAALAAVKGLQVPHASGDALGRLQNTINGLSEDVGDLDQRLASLERKGGGDPWSFNPDDAFMMDSDENEVITAEPYDYMPSFKEIILSSAPKSNNVVVMPESAPEPKPEPVIATAPVVATVVAPVTVTATAVAPKPAPTPEPEAEEEEEETDAEPLEPFDFQGKEYYKDTENNVYTANEEGEVDETPVGRWVEKRQTIKFYSLNA